MTETTENDEPGIHPVVARRVAFGMVGLLLMGLAAIFALRKSASPPPVEIASDPFLVQGREVFLGRCASCHGEKGKGDGPIAKGLKGKPVGDLTAGRWKHGDRLEQVREVIALGVPDTNMSAWGRALGDEDLRAVTAYVYVVAGREVPAQLRKP